MGIYTEAVQKLYVAYFSRPADVAGLAYWENVVAAADGDTSGVAAAFAASKEYQDEYAGKNAYQIVATVYQNLFGHEPDVAGLSFWGSLLMDGTLSIDKIVTDIAAGAQGSDLEAVNAKIAAAAAFTSSLDTTSKILGYAGDKANALAKAWLGTVNSDATLAEATAPAALDASVGVVTETGLAEAGTEYTLTNGIDTIIGSQSNDTIVAVVNENNTIETTLTALDVIKGGAGTDTLKIDSLYDLTTTPVASISEVENVVVRSAGTVALNTTAWNGVEKVSVTEVKGATTLTTAATTDVDVEFAVKAAGIVTVNGGKDVDVNLTKVGAGSGVAVNGATGAVNVNVTGRDAVNGAVTFNNIAVTGGSSINVTQTATSNAAGVTSAITIQQGDVYVNGSAATTDVTVKQSAVATAKAQVAEVVGKHETTTLKFSAAAKNDLFTVGTLVFKAAKDLTAAEVAQAFANLVNGVVPEAGDTQGGAVVANGTYTGKLAGWTSAAAVGDTVTFTSEEEENATDLTYVGGNIALVSKVDGAEEDGAAAVLGVGAGAVYVRDEANSIKTVSLDSFNLAELTNGFTKLETLNLANSTAAVTVADSAATLAVNLSKFGTSTTAANLTVTNAPATLNVNVTGANIANVTASATEALNVAGTGSLKTAAAGLAGLKAITVADQASLTVTGTVANAATIDASATTGDINVAIKGQTTAVTGGAGKDTVTVDATTTALSKAIKLGAGNDTLDLSLVDTSVLQGATGALEGGEGKDTIVLSAAAAQALSATAGFEAKIAGFEQLSVGKLGAATLVNLDNLDDINYVIANGAAAAAAAPETTTLQGSAGTKASAVVTFNALIAGQSITIDGVTVTARANVTADLVAAAFLNLAGGSVDVEVDVGEGYQTWVPEEVSGNSDAIKFVSKAVGEHTFSAEVGSEDNAVVQPPAQPTVSDVVRGEEVETEVTSVTFAALTIGQSVTVAGMTVTATGDVSAADVAATFRTGTATGSVTITNEVTGWETDPLEVGTTVVFTSETEYADVADLEVTTGGGAGSTLTLANLQSGATIELNNANTVVASLKDDTGAADVLNLVVNSALANTVTAEGVETVNVSAVASHTLNLVAEDATTIVVSGKAAAAAAKYVPGTQAITLDSTTKSVSLIDASAATSKVVVSGLADAVAVTIKGGSNNDVLTSVGTKADVLIGGAGDDILVAGKGATKLTGGEGNDVFKISVASANVNSYATINDFEAGDLIQFTGVTGFSSAQVELGDTAVFQDYANAVVNALGTNEMGWFVFQGNTYIVADMGADSTNGFVDGHDFIVKIVGELDLSQASFNSQYGTVGLV